MRYSKTAFLILLLLATQFTLAQIVPEEAKASFVKKYPGASQISWSFLENKSGFQVNFFDSKKHRHSIYSIDSKWVQTNTIINTKQELPRLVRLTVDETYPKSNYDWMEWFESPDENHLIIAITSGTEEKEELLITITKEGQILRVSKGDKKHNKQ